MFPVFTNPFYRHSYVKIKVVSDRTLDLTFFGNIGQSVR